MIKHIFFSKGLLLILTISLSLHILFLIKNPGNVFNDAQRYGEEISLYGSRDAVLYSKAAWKLINDGVYAINSNEPNAYVTPGQPIYLAIIFKTSSFLHFSPVTAVKVSNLILSCLTTFLIYQISMNLFFKKKIAIISSLLYATYFSPLHYFRALLTEIPGIFMMCFTLLIFVIALKENKNHFHILFGILFSITIMIRPTPAPIIILCLGVLIYKYGWKISFQKALYWAIGPVIVILPWTIRNLITLGHLYIFSSHSGNPMLAGTNPFFLENFNEISAQGRILGITENEYAIQRIKEGFQKQTNLYLSWFTVGKIIVLFQRPSAWHGYLPSFKDWTTIVYIQHFIVVLGGAITGIIFRGNKKILTLFLFILFYIGITLMFIPDDRIGFYIIPIFCVLAGYGIALLLEKIIKLNSKIKSLFSR